jgi:hypothetical protein
MLGGGFCIYFALPRSDPHGADLAYNDGSSRIGTSLGHTVLSGHVV